MQKIRKFPQPNLEKIAKNPIFKPKSPILGPKMPHFGPKRAKKIFKKNLLISHCNIYYSLTSCKKSGHFDGPILRK